MLIIDILKFIIENIIFLLIKIFEFFGYCGKLIYNLLKYFFIGMYQIFYTIMSNFYKISAPILDPISDFFSKILKYEKNGLSLVLKNKTFQTCFSGFLIFLGSMLIVSDVYGSYIDTKNDSLELDNFLKSDMNNDLPDVKNLDETSDVDNTNLYNINDEVDFSKYYAAIEIPSIEMKQGIKKDNGSNKIIDASVASLVTSDMPDVDNGNYVLAGHSGNGNKSYFKDVGTMKENDTIIIYYNAKKYYYKVYNVSEVHETNLTPLERVKDKTIVTLITCKNTDDQYRIIVQASLISVEEYIYE